MHAMTRIVKLVVKVGLPLGGVYLLMKYALPLAGVDMSWMPF